MQDGESAEPTLGKLPLQFEEYDLANIHLWSLDPPGGPSDASTTLTLSGDGFKSYGDKQVVCSVGRTVDSAVLVPGDVIDSYTVFCMVPAAPHTWCTPAPCTFPSVHC